MKKLLVLLLICAAAAGAFAEFRWVVDTTVATNAYGILIPTGRHAEAYVQNWSTGDKEANVGIDNIMNTELGLLPRKPSMILIQPTELLNGYYIPISQSFFRPTIPPGGFTWTEGSGLGIQMHWSANNITAFMKIGGIGGSATSLMDHFMYTLHRNKSEANLQNLLLQSFTIPEYWARANTRLFDVTFGNRGAGGRVDIFQDHTDWIPTPVRVDGFGVNVPSNEGPINTMEGHRNLNNIGADDFLFAMKSDSWSGFDVSSYIAGIFKMNQIVPGIPFPLFVDLAMDFDPGIFVLNDNSSGTFGQSRVGGAIRVSLVDVGNIFTADIAYKLRGGDPTPKMNDIEDEEVGVVASQPDGMGSTSHVIGAYFNIPKLVPDLGIGFGYTALFRVVEDKLAGPDDDRYTIQTKSPVFSGFDLFLRYGGIQDLRLTFKTNLSFAKVPEVTFDEDRNAVTVMRIGLIGTPHNTRFYSQDWFAMYNSLAAKLIVAPRMNLNLEVISHLGVITDYNSNPDRSGTTYYGLETWGTRKRTKHTISGSIYANNQISGNINFQIGVSVYSEQAFTTLSDFTEDLRTEFVPTEFKAGGIGIAIPIKMKLVF